MSEGDALSAVALVVALVALVISVVQLLQAIFGTAEGFRRTNRQIMGPFSQTRDRVFHITELRYETTFRTPHFKFQSAAAPQSKKKVSTNKEAQNSQNNISHKTISPENHSDKDAPKPNLYIEAYRNEDEVLQKFITDPAAGRISKLQRLLHWADSRFNKTRSYHLIEQKSKAYAAGWLLLLDQLLIREKRMHHTAEGPKYIHRRLLPAPDTTHSALVKIDEETWQRPAIELEPRSWDLMPPDVVRPLASIDMGDFLTLCFRLRIGVNPEDPKWSAEGSGHSFSRLIVQGLGTVVQYRFDTSLSYFDANVPANGYFAPSEACDKLAFGIIPGNPTLGIEREEGWKVNAGPNFIESIMIHFDELGISEETRRMMRDDKTEDKHNTSEALCESLLLLCPSLVVDGLGIVKYVPPYPLRWAECTLRYRESYIVLRTRLNKMYERLVEREEEMNNNYPGPTEKELTSLNLRESQTPPTRRGKFGETWKDQKEWVGAVLNFLARTYRDNWNSVPSLHSKFGKNAKGRDLEEILRQLRTALDEADQYLQKNLVRIESGAYEALVAAHVEMTLIRHTEVKKEERKQERDRFKFRDETGVHGIWTRKTETVHRYIDSAMALPVEDAKPGATIVGLFRKHYNTRYGNPSKISTQVIQEAWFTMMLRAILWGFIHFPIHLPWLPYKSRYYGNSTLVMIA